MGAQLKAPIMLIVAGLVTFLVGLSIAPTVISQAVTTGTTTGIGSFAGTQAIVDLLPLIFVIGLLVLGVGAMIGGGISAYRSARSR